MDQAIRYTTTGDGVSIAYAVIGSGPMVISVPSPPDNHLQLEWDEASRRAPLERMARHRTLVRYDGRGTGLSSRDAADFSLAGRLADLEAVVDRLGIEQFALLGGSFGNFVSVAYAATHPERVTHLIAVAPFIRGKGFGEPSEIGLYSHMLEHDYTVFTQTMGASIFGWGSPEATRFAAFFRACVTQETAHLIYTTMLAEDISQYLDRLRCPVLVFASEGMTPLQSVRDFAAAVPNATLIPMGKGTFENVTFGMHRQIGAFLGENWDDDADVEVDRPPQASPTRTMLFTDLEDHTTMMYTLGDARGRQVLRDHERIIREALLAHDGTEVKSMGDGFMATFTSSQAALQCAIVIQQRWTEFTRGLQFPLAVRVGINAGEPIAERDDLFGASVIVAARIASLAQGGQVLVSNVVRELVAGKGFLFADTGAHVLKGMEESTRLWELSWRSPPG